MEKTNGMSLEETARAKAQADQVNGRLKKKDGAGKGDMNKDTFMKLLVTQLQHQDPTQPMADREFIAQMAQFSSLEQMQNINAAIQSMNRSSRVGEAYALLGRKVEAMSTLTGKPVQGVVTKVFFRENEIRVMVGRDEVGLGDIHAVVPNEEAAPRVPASAIRSGVRTNFLPPRAINESKPEAINNDSKKDDPVKATKIENDGSVKALEIKKDEPVKAYEKNEVKSPEKAVGK